jgi:hypothetical protein
LAYRYIKPSGKGLCTSARGLESHGLQQLYPNIQEFAVGNGRKVDGKSKESKNSRL